MNGHRMDYHYGNKAQWRRHVWNRVSERVEDKRGLVIFLAAKDALDVEVASRKGFKPVNMIAVEREKVALKALREAGQLTIDGDLFATIHSWPNDRPVAVVFADLCGGLSEKTAIAMLCALKSPAMAGTVFAVNMLRGRDDAGVDACTFSREQCPQFYAAGQDLKHRGIALAGLIAGALAQDIKANVGGEGDTDQYCGGLVNEMDPTFYSYKSSAGNQVFDTVVFKNPCYPKEVRDSLDAAWKSNFYSQPQRRKIAANLAHHTMRSAQGVSA